MTQAVLLQALRQPAIYPQPTTRVDMRETHISVVFLTDQHAYKIKKSLNMGFLDYSTLARRRLACQQELLLNRRLSTAVYDAVVPLYYDGSQYTFEATGAVVEYALKMRRLPDDCTLEALLGGGRVTTQTMAELARLLVTFHQTYPLPDSAEHCGSLEQIRADWQENFAQTAAWIDRTITPAMYTQIQTVMNQFITRRATWFVQRVHAGRIRDCHGDLRAEHIYLEPHAIQIIDCIEFNTRFRFIDVASEVAFLAMDLERLGAASLAQAFVSAYVQSSNDVTLYRLLDFYRCYRAYVRGKVTSMRLPTAPQSVVNEPLQHKANQYFALAARYAERCTRPLLLITTGLIGSGKSSIAAAIAEALDLYVLSSDQIRKQRAGLAPTTPQRLDYGTGLYSPRSNRQLYDVLAGLAANALRRGDSVIVDAAFSKQADRQRMAALGQEVGADFLLLDCVASVEAIQARLAQRRHTPGTISDGREEIFAQFQRDYEPVIDHAAPAYIRLDTTQSLTQCLHEALAAIQAGRQ